MESLAFVGDVHGELLALRSMVAHLQGRGVERVVFLGDYINKGPCGPDVVEELIELSEAGYAQCLRGNHETALLECIDSEDVRALLRMSGAPTIRAYVGRDTGPDVMADLLSAIPASHVRFFRGLADRHETDAYIASHYPIRSPSKFTVSAHVYVGPLPNISLSGAAIDTGCGTSGGLLTGLLWPALDYVQVDALGALVTKDRGGTKTAGSTSASRTLGRSPEAG